MSLETYRVREVHPKVDEEIAADIHQLHHLCHANTSYKNDLDLGRWWVATKGGEPVGYSGLLKVRPKATFIAMTGVLPAHRNQGLKRKLVRAMEQAARKMGMTEIYSYTTPDNASSANSLIRLGYKIFVPKAGLTSMTCVVYWRKKL